MHRDKYRIEVTRGWGGPGKGQGRGIGSYCLAGIKTVFRMMRKILEIVVMVNGTELYVLK